MSKIVIVDDSKDLLDILKYYLEEKGYEVEVASRKKDLLSIIKSFTPDLLVLDIFLQGEDGRNICKDLKTHKETENMCILMFSASPKALGNYKEYGADGFIEKPFGLDEIIEKIEATIESCKQSHLH